jgi:hypothetical protein
MKRLILAFFLALSTLSTLHAQVLKPVKWSYGTKRLSKTEGVVFIKATIDEDWHLYSQTVPDRGPTKTSFSFLSPQNYTLIGTPHEPKPIARFEKAFGVEVAYFENSVVFEQKVKLNGNDPVTVNGRLEYMACNDEKCLPPQIVPFSCTIK